MLNIKKEASLDQIKQQRKYRPYLTQLFLDQLTGKYLIVTNPYLLTEKNQEIIAFRYVGQGTEIVVPIKTWNGLLENGELRFVEKNNPAVIFEERKLLEEAINLLKEIKLELSLEDSDIINSITKFINSI